MRPIEPMKIATLPSPSLEVLARRLPEVPAGALLTIEAGPGAQAVAVKVEGDHLADEARLHGVLGQALAVAGDPNTPKLLGQVTGLVKDATSLARLADPALVPAGAGHVVDGLVVLTASVQFWQAVQGGKGALRVGLAGAELAANLAEAVWPTNETRMAGLIVRGAGRVVTITDLAAAAAKPSA